MSVTSPIKIETKLDQTNISRWILQCRSDKILPPTINQILTAYSMDSQLKVPAITENVKDYELRISRLSSSISYQRFRLDDKTDITWLELQIWTYITIGLAALTTLMVAISSGGFWKNNEKNNLIPIIIRISTLLFPALSTIVASVIAFNQPNERYFIDRGTLLVMDQLHKEMFADLQKQNCPGGDKNAIAKMSNLISSWESKYNDNIETNDSMWALVGQVNKASEK